MGRSEFAGLRALANKIGKKGVTITPSVTGPVENEEVGRQEGAGGTHLEMDVIVIRMVEAGFARRCGHGRRRRKHTTEARWTPGERPAPEDHRTEGARSTCEMGQRRRQRRRRPEKGRVGAVGA